MRTISNAFVHLLQLNVFFMGKIHFIESEPIRSNSSGANARGCWPSASSTTMPASYRNCSSAPSAGRITNGPTRSSERTRQSWKHVNLYGAYSFLDIGDGVDLQELVNLVEAARGRGAAAPD